MNRDTKEQKLPALETAAQNYLQNCSNENREAVVTASEALINHFAALYSPNGFDEDLKQAGYEGILKALKRFDPERGVLFSTYATHCIIGEIRHELRHQGSFRIPEWLRNLQVKIVDATEELAQKNGSMPTLQEISARVNVSAEGIAEAMQAGSVSLEEIDWSKVKRLRYESFKLPIEDVITVKMALSKMDYLQQKVVTMIYFEGLTQEQTARKLGLNQRKVSRLLNRSLNEMRVYVV